MLLDHIGDPASAAVVEEAVRRVVDAGVRTADLGGIVGTREFGAAVFREVEQRKGLNVSESIGIPWCG
jgi:methanogen homoisocitrate dehydrogenase